MVRAIITGGAGFIGSHLSERLLKDGHKVTVIDNLSTGSLENIAHFLSNTKFAFTQGDIRDAKLTENLAERNDAVFHSAADGLTPAVKRQKNF